METSSYDPNGIIAGDHALTHQPGTILSGEGALIRGTVMGQVSEGVRTAVGAASIPAPAGATGSASPVATLAALVGVHNFRCVSAGATGKWNHYDPDGELVGVATTGTEYVGGGLTLTIADSGTDPAVGEALKVTVTSAAASNKWKKAVAAAIDGSATPRAILADDADATSADVPAPLYLEGEFAHEMLTYGAGHTAASVEAAFRANSQPIYLKSIGAVA